MALVDESRRVEAEQAGKFLAAKRAQRKHQREV